ncbi:MAG: rod shape-determining protein MreD [Alphaproteobacteria bacterium]|nr:MAG: rod shape-determining protein MreD [Alphaproteobacteria bacterium]
MSEGELRLWLHRLAALAVALIVLAATLTPGTGPGRWPGPDPLLALVLALVLRAPQAMPLGSVVLLGLASDILRDLPPGAGALGMMLAAEFLRARLAMIREASFAAEWGLVALAAAGAFVVQHLVGALLLVPQPELGTALLRAAATALVHPLALGAAGLLGLAPLARRGAA